MLEKTLFVSRIGSNIDREELFQEFSYFGRIRSFRLIGKKRIAFVEMSTPREATNAMLGLNGIEINGETIRVAKARKPKE